MSIAIQNALFVFSDGNGTGATVATDASMIGRIVNEIVRRTV
jgi:hypothetical protein